MAKSFGRLVLLPLCMLGAAAAPLAADGDSGRADVARRIIAAYPEQGLRTEGGVLVWRDGTRMPLDDGKGAKSFEAWLNEPDIADTLAPAYPAGDVAEPPARDVDPGRARNAAFFDKMYGDCRKGEVERSLATVVWLPSKTRQRLRVTKINGVAQRLDAVSRELDRLPARFDVFLAPSAGTYNCRPIAGTRRISAHGHGIAIDIALKHAHYWRDAKPGNDGTYPWRNDIPMEIVRIFEKHGFIWGGKWYHYDTMHFEYRPELLVRD